MTSIWDYLFDSEWRQRDDINSLKETQKRNLRFQSLIRGKTVERMQKLEETQHHMGELALYCRTAVTLLMDKGIITREEFLQRMKEIGASDGKADGELTGPQIKP